MFLNLLLNNTPVSLCTKLQFKDFEPGEFANEKQRTCEETIELIAGFPWQEQREHLSIGLTNPSITIEGRSGDFLKLATYYHGKFILYYLDGEQHLYTHSFVDLADSYPFMRSFFNGEFETSGFQSQRTPFANNRLHFTTRTFTYTMQTGSTLALLSFVVLYCSVVSAAAVLVIVRPHNPMAVKLVMLLIGLFSLGMAITLIAQFANHYRSSKGRILTISRGCPTFYFGSIDRPAAFDKNDIQEIMGYGGYKGADGLKRTEIVFKDGRSVDISGLILAPFRLKDKFPGVVFNSRQVSFPFLPSAAS
jgi:hypothetical protein